MMSSGPGSRALVTVVVTVTGAPGDIEDLLASVPSALGSLEILFVIPEGEEQGRIRFWCAQDPRGRIVTAPSAATSDIRRVGLANAQGRWVTFPQPDARYTDGSLARLAEYLETTEEAVNVVALSNRREDPHSGEERGTNYGAWRFSHGNRVVDLGEHPDYVQTHFASAALRTAALRAHAPLIGITPTSADDALLIAAVLEGASNARLGLVANAVYIERYNGAHFEQFQQFRTVADNYLRRVTTARALVDHEIDVPRWLAFAVVHGLVTILRHEVATPRKAAALDERERARFLADAIVVARRAGVEAIEMYRAGAISGQLRALLRAWAGDESPQLVRRARVDRHSGSALLRYYFVGEVPVETFIAARNTSLQPQAQKVRAVDYFGQTVLRERIVWVDATVAAVELDGAKHELNGSTGSMRVRKRLHRRPLGARLRSARRTWLSRASAIRAWSRLPAARRRFEQAWAFMDRADLAGDNAEHLYRWVREHRPDINAWFILRQDSADWRRLEAEGFRLVPYGTIGHQVLLNTASEYLSSHAGVDVFRPRGDRLVGRNPSWRFTFLQHGVIHNDLSIWLNNQKIDLFVTSTHDEYSGIVGDGSPYIFTDREVRLTGLPRFDELRRRADECPWQARRTILIAPTWRNSLFLPAARPGEPRRPAPGFEQSDYVRSLVGILNDRRLHAAAEAHGLQIVFLPHPNVGEHFPRHRIPESVRVTSYAETNVQDLLSDARVFVTDYSSVAFDAAFAEAAVVYMQTDTGSVFGGDHTLHRGYFRFEEHGFGPVCTSVEESVDAIVNALSSVEATRRFRDLARDTFAHWDANARARLVHELTTHGAVSG